MQLTQCYDAPNDKYTFDKASGVWSDDGNSGICPKRCMQVEHGESIEAMVYAKPQPGGAMAVFAFNAGKRGPDGAPINGTMSLSVDLAKDLLLATGAAQSFTVRDIWNKKDLAPIKAPLVWCVR